MTTFEKIMEIFENKGISKDDVFVTLNGTARVSYKRMAELLDALDPDGLLYPAVFAAFEDKFTIALYCGVLFHNLYNANKAHEVAVIEPDEKYFENLLKTVDDIQSYTEE